MTDSRRRRDPEVVVRMDRRGRWWKPRYRVRIVVTWWTPGAHTHSHTTDWCRRRHHARVAAMAWTMPAGTRSAVVEAVQAWR
jgi:hypothetical protein